MATTHQRSISRPGRRFALRLFGYQTAVALVVIGLFGLLQGVSALTTSAAGATIALVPQLIFIIRAFQVGGARIAQEIVQGFYAGEAFKLMLTVLLFVLAFLTLNEPWLPLLVTYAVVVMMHWLAPVLFFKTN